MDARKLIDFAMDEDGAEFRSQLYATLYDRTVAAMQERKQNIAQGLVTQEAYVAEEEEEEKHHADEKEDEAMVKRMVKKSALKEEDDEELEEGWEDRLAAAREKAKEKGLIKDKPADEKKEPVKKVSGSRYGGSKQKSDEIDEEAEQIDEISKKTMGSYIKKATDSLRSVASERGQRYVAHSPNVQGGPTFTGTGNYDPKTPVDRKLSRKNVTRTKGIKMAADRLSKEELSKEEENWHMKKEAK